jgi:hypothetical protein
LVVLRSFGCLCIAYRELSVITCAFFVRRFMQRWAIFWGQQFGLGLMFEFSSDETTTSAPESTTRISLITPITTDLRLAELTTQYLQTFELMLLADSYYSTI